MFSRGAHATTNTNTKRAHKARARKFFVLVFSALLLFSLAKVFLRAKEDDDVDVARKQQMQMQQVQMQTRGKRRRRRRRSGEQEQEEEEQESVAMDASNNASGRRRDHDDGEEEEEEEEAPSFHPPPPTTTTTAPSSPVSPPAAAFAVSSKNRRFVGDIKLHASLVSLVERRATPRKKRLIMTTFDERSYVFALHHALNVERVLRESEFSDSSSSRRGGGGEEEEEDIGGWVALTYKEETCVEFERLWKLAHEHNYRDEDVERGKERRTLKSEIGCVWDSRFSGPDGTVWTALNNIHENLVRAVTEHGHLLWMARWDLMARIALRGVQVIGSDADVVFTTNPFPFLT